MRSGQPFWKQPIAVAVYSAGHTPWLLKNPCTVNGDSVPSLTSSAWARSHHCCALSSVLYICSVHHLLIITSSLCCTSCFLLYLSPLLFLAPHLLLCAAPVQGWSCRAEAEGVFVVNREAGEPTPDQRFMKKCGDLGTDLLLQRFSSCLFLFLASPGMLNVDWWMFPNSAFPTLSATTTSRYTFLTFQFSYFFQLLF